MMRKHLLVVVVFSAILIPLSRADTSRLNAVAFSHDRWNDGWRIHSVAMLNTGHVEQCLEIPEQINGLPVRVIGENMFTGNLLIRSIKIPSTVCEIGTSAFAGCSNLVTVTITGARNDVRSYIEIGRRAFYNCVSLEAIVFDAFYQKTVQIEDEAFARCARLKNVSLPHTLHFSRMSASSFNYCTHLEKIDIATACGLDAGVFVGCPMLARIIVSDKNAMFAGRNGIMYTKNGRMLLRCPPMIGQKEIAVPDGVEFIACCAFESCRAERILLPKSLKVIDIGAFSDCSNLTEMTIPPSVRIVEDGAFTGCQKLNKIVFQGARSEIDVSRSAIEPSVVVVYSDVGDFTRKEQGKQRQEKPSITGGGRQ
jgi:hypothetical protein